MYIAISFIIEETVTLKMFYIYKRINAINPTITNNCTTRAFTRSQAQQSIESLPQPKSKVLSIPEMLN